MTYDSEDDRCSVQGPMLIVCSIRYVLVYQDSYIVAML